MSDRDFELYLSALSRLLRLNAGQREGIADELRDHLEERLAELTALGVPHDDAVRRALDEFGDAAGLAAHFTHLSKRRTRRLLMRWTLGTIVTASVVALVASAFWPQAPGIPEPQAVNAQGGFGGGGLGGSGGRPAPAANRGRAGNAAKNAELEKKLAQQLDKVDWVKIPVGEIITQISRMIKADIIVDAKHFDDLGNDLKTEVTLTLEFSKVTARTALEMVMERAGFDDVAITFRDGLIYLTSEELDRYIDVYNCRDLLEGKLISMTLPGMHPGGGLGGGLGGGGFFSVAAQAGFAPGGNPGNARKRNTSTGKKKSSKPGSSGMGSAPGSGGGEGGSPGGMPGRGAGGPMGLGGGGAMMGGIQRAAPVRSNAEALIAVIQATVTSTEWQSMHGTGASIAEFNGLLIVTASHHAHADIKQLLEKLRVVAKEHKAAK